MTVATPQRRRAAAQKSKKWSSLELQIPRGTPLAKINAPKQCHLLDFEKMRLLV
jgi:hypothetical protein